MPTRQALSARIDLELVPWRQKRAQIASCPPKASKIETAPRLSLTRLYASAVPKPLNNERNCNIFEKASFRSNGLHTAAPDSSEPSRTRQKSTTSDAMPACIECANAARLPTESALPNVNACQPSDAILNELTFRACPADVSQAETEWHASRSTLSQGTPLDSRELNTVNALVEGNVDLIMDFTDPILTSRFFTVSC